MDLTLNSYVLSSIIAFTIFFLAFICFDYFTARKTLKNEIVLITGGAKGLGKAIAEELLSQSATVIVWDIDEDALDAIVQQNDCCRAMKVDVSDYESARAAKAQIIKEIGHVTVVINNAAILNAKNVVDLPYSHLEKAFKVNTLSSFLTCSLFLPNMLKNNNGHIVTVSSVLGGISMRKLADYCATKSALMSFHECLAIEIDDYKGIGMTLMCPATLNTPMFDGAKSTFFPTLDVHYVAKIITKEIQKRERRTIIMPMIFYLLPFYQILPIWIKCTLIKLFGANADEVKGTYASEKADHP